jgi:hypothetical protein
MHQIEIFFYRPDDGAMTPAAHRAHELGASVLYAQETVSTPFVYVKERKDGMFAVGVMQSAARPPLVVFAGRSVDEAIGYAKCLEPRVIRPLEQLLRA